jgi:type II secretion system protein C
MEALVHRNPLTMLRLLVVGFCAVMLGRAATSALELRLHQLPVWPAGPPAARATSPARRTEPGQAIVARNVFCSICPPIADRPATSDPAGTRPRPTSLPLALLVTNHVVPMSGSTSSSAVLRDTESRSVGLFVAGDRVKGATITAIEETRVHLDHGGVPEFLDLLDAPPAPGLAAAPASRAPVATTDPLAQALARGIKHLGEHRYELQRSAVEAALGNVNVLARSARIVPEVREGKAAGFRLHAVVPGGPFDLIGLQNGDIVSSINGIELTSPEKAFEAYGRLRSASHLSLGLERGGRRVGKEYTLR